MKLKWQQAPGKTQWGDEMVVASVAIDKDHTLSLFCKRAQAPKVEAMFAQRTEQDVPEASCGNMEPVGWLESPDGAFRANPLYKIKFPSKLLSWQVPLYMALPEQEPVQFKCTVIDDAHSNGIPLEQWTTPPQRKPLTDEQIAEALGFGEHTTATTRAILTHAARAIEAKIKENK